MYRHILLTLDGSDVSRAAIPHAVQLAAGTGARVTVVEAIDSEAMIIAQSTTGAFAPAPSGRITAEVAHEAVEGQREEAERELQAAAERLRAAGIENVATEVIEGDPADAIVAASKRLGADLIVMATHGRSGLKRAILGSVADHVVRHTPHAAVLLVKPEGLD